MDDIDSTQDEFLTLPHPDFHFRASPPDALTSASSIVEERARPPGPRLSRPVGRPPSELAPRGVPRPGERVDPDRPSRGHPISRQTYSSRLHRPQRAPCSTQTVHPFGLRGGLGRPENASAPDT